MTTNHLAIETRPAKQGDTMRELIAMADFTPAKMLAEENERLLKASIGSTPRPPAMQGIRPLAARYYETKLAVESVMHNLETAVSDTPHEDNATEVDLARMVNTLAKLRIALQEVTR